MDTFERSHTISLYRNPDTGKGQSVDPYIPFSDGVIYTIRGSGFGTKIGISEHIKQTPLLSGADGSNGVDYGRWISNNYIGASNVPKIQSAGGISGKYLQFLPNSVGNTEPNNAVAFTADNYIAMGQQIFHSCWVSHSTVATGGQWKYSRIQRDTESVGDKINEMYFNANTYTGDNKMQFRDSTFDQGTGANDKVTYMSTAAAATPHSDGRWQRMDVLIKLPPNYATGDDFSAEYWLYDPVAGASVFYGNGTPNQPTAHINPFDQAGTEWRQVLWQNYIGNTDFNTQSHTLNTCGHFVSWGDQKRVEFCDNANMSLVKKPFVQPIVSWSDTEIKILCDSGDMTSGFLNVIGADGTKIHGEVV